MCASVMNNIYTLYSGALDQAALYFVCWILINRMHRSRVFIFYVANCIRIFLLSEFKMLIVKPITYCVLLCISH